MSAVTSPPAATSSPSGGDVARQVLVAGSAVLAIVGLAIGSGAFAGTATERAAGGAFSDSATLIAPAGPAFSIWSVIYLGLLALGVWQALPAQRSNTRQRQVGWLVAVSMLANTAWILVVQAGGTWASVAVIAILLVTLIACYARLLATRPDSGVERVLVDGTMGLYLGWVTVATPANVAAAATSSGWAPTGSAATALAVGLVVVVAVIGCWVGWIGSGRWAFSVALAWGLGWLAVGRLTGDPRDTVLGVVAGATALAVLAVVPVAAKSGQVPSPRRS